MKRAKVKNLFFPISLEEEAVEEECDLEGEGLYANDWYDLPGGQYFVIFPSNDGYAEEAN